MKQIIVQVVKGFLFIMGIFLIMNIQVFSQTAQLSGIQQLNEEREILKRIIIDLSVSKQRIGASVTPIGTNELSVSFDNYKNSLNNLKEQYITYMQKEQSYYTQMMPKKYMEELTHKYTGESNEIRELVSIVRGKDEAIFYKLEKMTDIIEFLSDRKLSGLGTSLPYEELLSETQLQEWNNCVIYLTNRFKKGLEAKTIAEIKNVYKENLVQMAVLFEKSVSPGDIMEYAFRYGMLPKEQEGIKLVLQTMNNEIPVRIIAKNIISYLTDFNIRVKNATYSDLESLSKELVEMTVIRRAQKVEEIVELNTGSQSFIKDLKKLDKPTKSYISKGITKGFWVLAGLGAIATAAYITDVATDNHFDSDRTMSSRDLSTIGKKIENGTANVKEKFAFFTNPTTEGYVEEDPVYTLAFVQFASDIYAADELLDTLKAQGQQIRNNVEQDVLKNVDKQMGTTDFGVGTL